MNFFGHAAVASWFAPPAAPDAAAFALGAMLPDFATMIGARLADDGDDNAGADATARGIALHHRTDAAFHRLPVVVGLMRDLGDRLTAAGCARGPTRAVAHIGAELLLDGELVGEPAYRASYAAAIAADARDVRWRSPEADARLAYLLDRLRAHGAPDDLRDCDAITRRLARVLADRPLLAPSAEDLRAIRGALIAFQSRVAVATAAVIRGMRAALADR